MARKVILDVDPGVSDALAICLALAHPDLEVVAVTATGGNVAPRQASRNVQAIIEHLEEQVLFPDIDVRQRLTLKSGYGVAEIPIDRRSQLANTRVGGCGLREREVAVLSIQRGSVTIPNPTDDREILPGDTLLCFGKLLTMRSMLSARLRKRARSRTRARKPIEGASGTSVA